MEQAANIPPSVSAKPSPRPTLRRPHAVTVPKPRPAKARLHLPGDHRSLADVYSRLDEIRRELNVQFTRIAQLQADLDVMRAAWQQAPDKAGT